MKEIVVDVGFNQTRVALVENKELSEIYIDVNKGNGIAGNIYKGRVTNVLPGMQAAFVDIGLEKNAFLFVKDAQPYAFCEEMEIYVSDSPYKEHQIDELLRVGQELIVQVVKEAIDTKGPRVTTHITLPGRFLVIMPSVDYVGVSRRICDETEKERLKEMAAECKPADMGLIVRTAAIGCSKEDFEADIQFLTKLWETILVRKKAVESSKVIHRDLTLIYKTVRDLFTKDVDRMVINNKEQYEKVIEIIDITAPHMKNKVEYYTKTEDLFESYQLEAKINRLASRKVWLKNKGYIVIDQTEALTSIDVNTGKFVGSKDFEDTVYLTNMEAAKEIGRQLRLRDIGGIIIIDFIDMHNKDHEEAVIEALKLTLKKDRTKNNVLGMTQLGLVEMTRKKVRQRIESVLLSPCPYCDGEGKILSNEMVARSIERELYKIILETNAEAVLLELGSGANPNFLAVLEERINFISKLYKKDVIIKLSNQLKAHQYSLRGCSDDFESGKDCV